MDVPFEQLLSRGYGFNYTKEGFVIILFCLQFPEATQTTGARRKQLPPPSSDSPISFSAPPEVPPPPLPKKQASYVNVIQVSFHSFEGLDIVLFH